MTYKRFVAMAICSLILHLVLAPAQAQSNGENQSTTNASPITQSTNSERPAFRKGVMELHLGRINAGGDLKSTFSAGFAGGVNFGWRFNRYLQADFGVDFARGAANVNRTINTTGGLRTVGDDELFVPIGARVVLPLAKERVLLSAGGGYAYLKYSESARPASANEQVICTSCTSRSGNGSYQMFQVNFLVDRNRHFGLGFTAKLYQAKTTGDGLGTALSFTSKDRWTNLYGTFGFHF